MTSVVWALLIVFLALGSAVSMYRTQRARGVETNWSKTLATGLATIALTAVGITALIGGFEGGYPMIGLAGFVVIFIGGIVVITIYVRRRWPT
jgi:phosphatidylglycerophosphate synthase